MKTIGIVKNLAKEPTIKNFGYSVKVRKFNEIQNPRNQKYISKQFL